MLHQASLIAGIFAGVAREYGDILAVCVTWRGEWRRLGQSVKVVAENLAPYTWQALKQATHS